jgi:hypothetical protein
MIKKVTIILLIIIFMTEKLLAQLSPIGTGISHPDGVLGIWRMNNVTLCQTYSTNAGLIKIDDNNVQSNLITSPINEAGQIKTVVSLGDKLVLGGNFTYLISTNCMLVLCDGIALYDTTTHVITPLGTGISVGAPLGEYVYKIIVDVNNSNSVIAVGKFLVFDNALDSVANIMRVDVQTGEYFTLYAISPQYHQDYFRDAAFYNGDLYVAGSIHNNNLIAPLAKVAIGLDISPSGSYQGVGMSVAVLQSGVVVVGDIYDMISPNLDRALVWNGTATSVLFTTKGNGFIQNQSNTLCLIGNKLFVGGGMDSVFVGGQAFKVNKIFSLDIFTSAVDDCGGGVTLSSPVVAPYHAMVYGMTKDVNTLYVAGLFDSPGNNICTLNPPISTGTSEDVNIIPELLVYPNPAKDFVTIEVTKDDKLQIWSMDGRLVFQNHLALGKNRIELQNFQTGMYIIQVGEEKKVVQMFSAGN